MRTAFTVLLLFSSTRGIIDVFDGSNRLGEKDHHFLEDSSNGNQIVREDIPEQFQNNGNSHNLNISEIPDVDQVDKNVNEFADFWNKLKQEQEQKYNEFREKIKEKEQEKLKEKQEDQEEFKKFKDFWNKLRQEEEKRYNDFKEKVEQKKEEIKAERQAKYEERMQQWQDYKQQTREKWDSFRNTMREKQVQRSPAIQQKTRSLLPPGLSPEQKKQAVEELLVVFESIVNATKIKKAEEKARRKEIRQQLQPAIDEFFTNLRTKIGAWRAAKEAEKAQRWAELKTTLLLILQGAEQRKTEKNAALREFWQSVHDKVAPILSETGAAASVVAVEPAVKASFLDTITGVSSWQTITWILLAICVALAMALLVLVIYQTTQKKKFLYQRLPGNDSETPTLYPKRELQQAF